MQFGLAKHVIALLLAAPLLAGCLERGQPTMVDTSADDDAFCRANNVAAGSNDYVICRKNRDVQRGNANARDRPRPAKPRRADAEQSDQAVIRRSS